MGRCMGVVHRCMSGGGVGFVPLQLNARDSALTIQATMAGPGGVGYVVGFFYGCSHSEYVF